MTVKYEVSALHMVAVGAISLPFFLSQDGLISERTLLGLHVGAPEIVGIPASYFLAGTVGILIAGVFCLFGGLRRNKKRESTVVRPCFLQAIVLSIGLVLFHWLLVSSVSINQSQGRVNVEHLPLLLAAIAGVAAVVISWTLRLVFSRTLHASE